LPQPVPGLVVRYSYLWRSEYERGQEEGVKDRPCAIIMVVAQEGGEEIVTVLPITHSPPTDQEFAVEIPRPTKQRLGLDSERSWVVISEANRFTWPGPDLRPIPGEDATTAAYGLLPAKLYRHIRERFIAAITGRVITRTE
jgi:hypothetical protein